ncbi:MAG: zinc/manganese transport system ATP-binding protein [Actinomycetota bacterium]|jgi:zinc/manganese transport system ATP-binding protein|nr:zinc/manganese transport system ATP-binding protein [Actinomycetota bacterium]
MSPAHPERNSVVEALDPPGPGPSPVGAPTVVAAGVAARAGGRLLFEGLDATVTAGQFVAVLGPNGAGKSTFLRMLLGLHPPAAGSLTVLGERPGRRNHDIGYLPQRRSFDSSVRIRGVDLVRLGVDGHRWGTPLPLVRRLFDRARFEQEQRHLDDVVARVGATAYGQRAIGEVSGGEQQRLLIAQALVRQPRLLLLDEPLDSLDLPNQQGVAALLQQISADGVTVVIVAHDVNPILGYLDQVIYIVGGRALAGPPETVITTENLSRLYGAPIEVIRTSSGQLVVVGQPDAASFHAH